MGLAGEIAAGAARGNGWTPGDPKIGALNCTGRDLFSERKSIVAKHSAKISKDNGGWRIHSG
jgi:hypothetical protein